MKSVTTTERRRVFITGMFDMLNFGDLLFPLIAARRLAPHGIEAVPVAPTAAEPRLADALPAMAIDVLFEPGQTCDAVLIGGGYMIHSHPLTFIESYDAGPAGDWAGPGLWLGATLAAVLRGIPIMWNAPGVPHPLGTLQQGLADAALRAADYVSLRDRGSAEVLRPPGDVEVVIVPDTVADVASLWTKAELAAAFRTFLERKRIPDDRPLLALHIRHRSVAGVDLAGLAQSIEAFADAHGLLPVLMAVGQSHDDAGLARSFQRHFTTPPAMLDDPLSLREITAVLAHAAVYVGASLHGYVGSTAFGVPAALVARPAYRKFQGFLGHIHREADLARDWASGLDIAAEHLKHRATPHYPQAVFDSLDRHWAAIASIVAKPALKHDARHGFLRDWMVQGLDRNGPSWALKFAASRDVVRAREE